MEKTIKIKKKFTGIVLTGVVENGKTIERYVKPEEVVEVLAFVPAKLDRLKEGYEVITETKTKPGDDRNKPLP